MPSFEISKLVGKMCYVKKNYVLRQNKYQYRLNQKAFDLIQADFKK